MILVCGEDKLPYVPLRLLQVMTCYRGVKSLTLLQAEGNFCEAEHSWKMFNHSHTREEPFRGCWHLALVVQALCDHASAVQYDWYNKRSDPARSSRILGELSLH